jgi:dethiobiotin synthetase
LKGLFVTATDTGVGKTTVSCALLAGWARRGRRVAAMKPCETGGGDDAERLIRACGRRLDPSLVRPYAFALPASPEAAAAAEGAPYVDIGNIRRALARLGDEAELVLVEGAGGLLVPLDPANTMAELANALELPLLIVARPSLGTINHTLLTVEAARARGQRVLGVIFSRADERVGPEEPWTPPQIARHGRVRIFGTLPHSPGADPATLAEQHLPLDEIWAALSDPAA